MLLLALSGELNVERSSQSLKVIYSKVLCISNAHVIEC